MAPSSLLLVLLFGLQQLCSVYAQSSWLLEASQLQRYLSDRSLDELVITSTHNSYNMGGPTSSVFETTPNQKYSITNQLTCLGVRGLELDPHYIAERNDTFICHAGAEAAPEVFRMCGSLGWPFCNNCGVYDFGLNNTGCSQDAPTLTTVLKEVESWLTSDGNTKEFIVLKFDSFMGDGREELVSDAIANVFDLSSVYTPAEWEAAGKAWPTLEDFYNGDKQIAFFSNEPSTYVFSRDDSSAGSEEDTIGAPRFNATTCNYREEPNPPFTRVQGSTSVINVAVANYTIFEGGSTNESFLSADMVPGVEHCGFSPTFDMMAEDLMLATIWSWDEGYPKRTGGGNVRACATFTVAGGRWRSEDCIGGTTTPSSYYHACVRDNDRMDWRLSYEASTFTTSPACPTGYGFAAPRSKYENDALLQSIDSGMAGAGVGDISTVWLYHVSAQGNPLCWTIEDSTMEWCVQQDYTDETCANLSDGEWTAKPLSQCLDPLAPVWFDSRGYVAPLYTPSDIVEGAHDIKRLKGDNDWTDQMSYAKDTAFAAIPILAVGLLASLLLVPCFTCFAYRRGRKGKGGDRGEGDDLGHYGVFNQKRRRSRRKAIWAVICAVLAGVGGVIGVWAATQLNDATSSFSYNLRGVADAIIAVQVAAEDAQGSYAQALTLMTSLLQCDAYASVFDNVNEALVKGSDEVDSFVEQNIGDIGVQVNKKLNTMDDTESLRKTLIMCFAVFGLILALLYIVLTCNAARVLYSSKLSTAQRMRDARSLNEGGESDASSSLRGGNDDMGDGDNDETLRKGKGPSRCKCCTGCSLIVVVTLTCLLLLFVWVLLAAAFVVLLYSSDFCMEPTDNMMSIPSDEIYAETIQYYSDCEDEPVWRGDLLKGYIYTYGSSVALKSIDTQEFSAVCASLTDDLNELIVVLDDILVQFDTAGQESSCSNINPMFNGGVNVALCTDTTSGLAWLSLGTVIAGVFLLFASLLLPCVLRDSKLWRRKRRNTLWRRGKVDGDLSNSPPMLSRSTTRRDNSVDNPIVHSNSGTQAVI